MRLELVAALAALAAAVTIAPTAKAETPTEVTIGLSSNSFVVGGLRIAEKAGLFEKNGLRAKLIVMDSGNATVTALISGSADFAVTGPTDALVSRGRGQPVVLLANLYRGYAGAVVISKAAAARANVAPNASLADRLKAVETLKLSGPSATAGYTTVIRNAADSYGVKLNFIYMAQPAMPAALESGAIDAFSAGPPFWGAAVAKGSGVLWVRGSDLPANIAPSSSSTLQTTEAIARDKPALIEKMRAVLAAMTTLIERQPARAKEALAKAYPQVSKADLDFAFENEADNWTKTTFTLDDVRQEIRLLSATATRAAVKDLDPRLMLWPRPN